MEPQNCYRIPSLAEETILRKDKKPIDIYLECCKDSAVHNLIKRKVSIEAYVLTLEDAANFHLDELLEPEWAGFEQELVSMKVFYNVVFAHKHEA